MAGKYYQGKKDRMDESRGMKDYYKNKGKRMDNKRDSNSKKGLDSGYMGMISEDHSAPANLPQQVVHSYYPPCEYIDNSYLDDTIKGVDETLDDNIKKVESHQSDSMY